MAETKHTPRMCAGCGEPVPQFGRKRMFFDSDEVVHDSDDCVRRRNERLDAERQQRDAGPQLFEVLRDLIAWRDTGFSPPGTWEKARTLVAALASADATDGGAE